MHVFVPDWPSVRLVTDNKGLILISDRDPVYRGYGRTLLRLLVDGFEAIEGDRHRIAVGGSSS